MKFRRYHQLSDLTATGKNASEAESVQLPSKVASQTDGSPVPVHRSPMPRNAKWRPFSGVRDWIVEMAAWLVCLAICAALAGLLASNSGKRIEDWQHSISLNALISVLVTLLYLFILVPISSCLAQLKWNHFTKAHYLYDFHLIDSASRTAFGSARILVRKPKGFLVAVAAILTLVVTALGPFVQQILSIRSMPTADGHGLMPILTNLTSAPDASNSGATASQILQYATNGAYTTQPQRYDPAYSCGGRNCTWDTYSTIAVESECRNIPHLVQRSSGTGLDGLPTINYTLPNGLYLNLDPATNGLEFDGAINGFNWTLRSTLTYGNRGMVILDPTFLYGSSNRVIAWDCVLYLAGETHTATYISQTFTENVIGTPFVNDSDIAIGYLSLDRDSTNVPPVYFTAPDNQTKLVVGMDAASGLFDVLPILFDSWDQAETSSLTYLTPPTVMQDIVISNPLNESIDLAPVIMGNMARSLSILLRTQSKFISIEQFTGNATSNVVVWHIIWGWIAIPAAIQVLTLLLLLLTIFDTSQSGMKKWGSSSLAVILHGADPKMHGILLDSLDTDSMNKTARGTLVRLDAGTHTLRRVE